MTERGICEALCKFLYQRSIQRHGLRQGRRILSCTLSFYSLNEDDLVLPSLVEPLPFAFILPSPLQVDWECLDFLTNRSWTGRQKGQNPGCPHVLVPLGSWGSAHRESSLDGPVVRGSSILPVGASVAPKLGEGQIVAGLCSCNPSHPKFRTRELCFVNDNTAKPRGCGMNSHPTGEKWKLRSNLTISLS